MLLWNIIRDFIVQYLTGGTLSDGQSVYCNIGNMAYSSDSSTELMNTATYMVPIKGWYAGDSDILYCITFGDWIATTITAVIICLLVVFAVWLVRWIFKAVSSAFLLK